MPKKLVIQIPCFNEENSLPVTLAALPREVLAVWNDVLQLSDAQCDSRSAFGEAKDAFH